MRVLCRADASIAIGSGHVMRCTTLGRALAANRHTVDFICRDIPGHLNDWLAAQGFAVHRIPVACTPEIDADVCRAVTGGRCYDWLAIDHYELGADWERAMAAVAERIVAFDDVGRAHECDLLIDCNVPNPLQNLYRLPARCVPLLGPEFALLRPEFAGLRDASLRRRRDAVRRVLVFMGGNDAANETVKVLTGLASLGGRDLAVDVVIGAGNPHRDAVEAACGRLAGATLHLQTEHMPELMAGADCMVGAGGNTTWERCALGLPAIVTILADNQVQAAEELAVAGAHILLGRHDVLLPADYARALAGLDARSLAAMSIAAANICDGRGLPRIMKRLEA